MQNPTWTRDELILLLDIYLRVDVKHVGKNTPEVIELSTVLNQLPIHPKNVRSPSFRNPAGVHMKLRNLSRFDPSRPTPGLRRGGFLEEIIWKEFSPDPTLLRQTAEAIRQSYVSFPRAVVSAHDGEEEFREGRLLSRVHFWRERNSAVVRKKKNQVLRQKGRLSCEACDFDFADRYGQLGVGYAECHHVLPLSRSSQERRTKLIDLAIVCANCHRMLHRSQNWLTVEALRSMIRSQKRSAGAAA